MGIRTFVGQVEPCLSWLFCRVLTPKKLGHQRKDRRARMFPQDMRSWERPASSVCCLLASHSAKEIQDSFSMLISPSALLAWSQGWREAENLPPSPRVFLHSEVLSPRWPGKESRQVWIPSRSPFEVSFQCVRLFFFDITLWLLKNLEVLWT